MKAFSVVVEGGKEGKDGVPAMGPVYRSLLAKDGFPQGPAGLETSWDVFSAAVDKYPRNRMLGWRPVINGKVGSYLWKTYKEVYEEVQHIGAALRASGAEPGSRIGIYGSNCPQWIVAMEACNGHSLICVPLYDTFGPGAVDFIIEHAEIDFVFYQDKKLPQLLKGECRSAKRLKSLICFTSVSNEHKDEAVSFGISLHSWEDFLKLGKGHPVEFLPPRPFDICTIMYTSGTSGDPKGAVITHDSIASYVGGIDIFMDQFEDKMSPDDVYLSFLPLAHILDRMIEEYFFRKGASVGYWQGAIDSLKDDLMELKPTLFAGVPRVFERVYEGATKALEEISPVRKMIFNALYKYKLWWMNLGFKQKHASPMADLLAFRKVKARLGGRVRLIISGGAPLSTEIEEFLRVTSCAFLIQGYGLTETCGLLTLGIPDEMSLLGTVGVASPYTELRLEEVEEMGYNPLGEISRGEIVAKGKTLFSEYYKNPELTKEVMKDGWFHTGDIGELRPDGILKIIDRKKNIFKLSQGEYVAVEYLEKIYGFASIVEDIWVYGDSFRSMLVAVVVPHEGNTKKWAELNGEEGGVSALVHLCSNSDSKMARFMAALALAYMFDGRMDEYAPVGPPSEGVSKSVSLDGARRMALRHIEAFVQTFSDPQAFSVAAASSTSASLAQVVEAARIQEAGHLRCSGAEIGRFVAMLRNSSSILKACAAFALLQFSIPGGRHAMHHASLLHKAGAARVLRSTAAAATAPIEAKIFARIVLRNLEHYPLDASSI